MQVDPADGTTNETTQTAEPAESAAATESPPSEGSDLFVSEDSFAEFGGEPDAAAPSAEKEPPAAEPTAEPATKEPAAQEPAAATPPVATPETPPTTTEATQPAETPPASSEAPFSSEEFAAQRQAAIDEVWPTFAPSEERIERLFNPETAREEFGRMGAEFVANAIERTLQMVNVILPQQIHGTLAAAERTRVAEDNFYKEFPALAEHRAVVEEVAGIYFAANPQMRGRPEAAAQVAAMTHALKNIPLNVPAPAGASPVQQSNQPPAAAVPHRPVGAGASPGAVAQPQEIWEPGADLLSPDLD